MSIVSQQCAALNLVCKNNLERTVTQAGKMTWPAYEHFAFVFGAAFAVCKHGKHELRSRVLHQAESKIFSALFAILLFAWLALDFYDNCVG